MTDEQINAAIAKACGVSPELVEWWAYKEDDSGGSICFQAEYKDQVEKWLLALPKGSWAKDYKPKPYYRYPDYCTDLNAMHEAEQYLWPKDWNARYDFIYHLGKILMPTIGYRAEAVDLLDATARERAEAFLRTLGKWEEGK